MSGAMPPALACRFTTGQASVMRIVADEVRLRGRCDRTMGEIAARAGVCIRLAQLAMRWAETLDYMKIEERRVSAFRNETNVITITAPEWQVWIAHGPRPQGGGCKEIHRTDNQYFQASEGRTNAARVSTQDHKKGGISDKGRDGQLWGARAQADA
jgi:hypothetical protein